MPNVGMGWANTPMTGPRARSLRNPLPQEYVDNIRKSVRYLINITDQAFVVQRTYGNFYIPPISKGRKFSVLELHGVIATTDEGDDKALQMIQKVEDIAADISNDINGHITMGADAPQSFLGVFVSETATPSKDDLEFQFERLAEFDGAVVRQGDMFWDDPKTHKEITAFHRRSATRIHAERPWLYKSNSVTPCPSCSKPIGIGLAVCPQCNAILDEAKARQYHPDRFIAIDNHRRAEAEEKKAAKGAK